ncbi:MAG: 3-dehydroquinate dehydratase/shikimate dehydrogenase [Pseudohongiellaceae bacterium]|jgi:3-dehydroquinate dehydratase/shikimate dehydrogenase
MTTRLVATVMVGQLKDCAQILLDPPPGVDDVELRIDGLSSPEDVVQLLKLPRSIPVIVTCRGLDHGGSFAGSEADRLALLVAAARAGADMIDVEDKSLADLPGDLPCQIIASCHLKRFLPRLEALGKRLLAHGTRFAKLAIPANNCSQLTQLLQLQETLGERIAIVPTGLHAEAGRVMLAGRGCPLTYGAAHSDDPGHSDQPNVQRLQDVYHVGLVNRGTRFFAVIGSPVAHSLSPAYHNSIFRSLAQPARMVPLDVTRISDVISNADALRLDGMAVTHPLKRDALAVARAVMPGARSTSSANTLLRTPAGWQARNTDWIASCDLLPRILTAWRADLGDPHEWLPPTLEACWRGQGGPGQRKKTQRENPPKVFLLGSGGAARAVAVAMFEQDVELSVWSRRLANARELAGDLAETLPALVVPEPAHLPVDLAINATPVGMPGVDPFELQTFSADNFRPGAIALDLAYGGDASPFRDAAAEAGAPLIPGEVFFGLQARRQAEVFAGITIPADVRLEAARRCGAGG